MGNTFYFIWEVELIEWIQGFLGDFGEKLCSIISMFGEELISVLLLASFYFWLDKEKGKKMGLNTLAVQAFFPMLKNIAKRRRPYMDFSEIRCLKQVHSESDLMDVNTQGFSFPSGHSATAAVVFGSLAYYLKKNWMTIIAFIVPLLVGISRFSLGVHYPTDVLAGWAFGALVVFLLPWLQNKIKSKKLLYGLLFLLSLPGWFYCTSNDYYSGCGMLLSFCLVDLFEERYVNFQSTQNPVRGILRLLIGGGIFLGLNALLKMPFSKEFLESASFLAHLVRFLRYAIDIFICMGVFPISFRYFNPLWEKKEKVAKTSEEE